MNEVVKKDRQYPSIWDVFRDFGISNDWPVVAPYASAYRADAMTPAIDVHESKSCYTVSAELPGIKKEDIHVSLQDGVLTINAESKTESNEEKDARVIRQERHYGNLVRSMKLGNDVVEENVKAEYKDGILKLSIPKKEEAKPRVIDVKVS